jgi:hypothetical protein
MSRGDQRGMPGQAHSQDRAAVSADPRSSASAIDAFVSKAKAVSAFEPAGHLVFALDATLSRQPTWDLACRLQTTMFETAAASGGLAIQLVYFRGFAECRASSWVRDGRGLSTLMTKIDCRGGETQIERVLRHIRTEARARKVGAFVYVGDAMEERIDPLCALAGELGLLGIRGFFFQEGHDPVAERAFREMARLTRGAYERFDQSSPDELASLLKAAAAYAAGGKKAMTMIAGQGGAAGRRLLAQLD